MTTSGRSALLGAALLGLVVVAVLSVGIGAHALAPGEVVRALLGEGNPSDRAVVLDIRMPRAVLAIGVGAALAVGGVLVQALSRNALAEPGVLGVTAGAGFAIAVGSSFGLAASAPVELGLAVLGALGASALVYAVGSKSPLRLVLAGTALSAVLLGLTLGLRLLFPDTFDVYRFWSVGSLAGREQAPTTVPLIIIGLSLLGAFAVSRQLNAIALGETVAHTLGANVARVRTITLLLITLMAGAATALAGPILFVGLIVPHLARRVAGASIPWLIAFAALLGPVLMLAADVGSRVLLPTGEVPVAIVTAFLGGPVLIWAVRKYGAAPL
ncbi:ABC transporter permease [Amycolatopsis sp. WAC 04182]|uniref:FecCD family ABC transporter permease n=1 Tax=Amycolatopsis sp. WAC 04182 TaxID=2203198 RepID=UPI000F7A0370|nr:iron ABC transporter permease [Amycolatopsis sp. WAC 04182]RSN61351.1 ABC transporter permease [Amycolatopsis sp. WAC 04182]